MMKESLTLLKPRFWSFRNQDLNNDPQRLFKLFLLFTLGLVFWIGIFIISIRVLTYFSRIEEIGEVLAFKLLSMICVTIFFLIIFSSILTCLSKLYLSKDLLLVHSMPVEPYKIFIARWIESTD